MLLMKCISVFADKMNMWNICRKKIKARDNQITKDYHLEDDYQNIMYLLVVIVADSCLYWMLHLLCVHTL